MKRMLGLGMLALSCACTADQAARPRAELTMQSCRLPRVERLAECGRLDVPARPEAPSAGQLSLRVVRLAARGHAPRPDPLLLLAGGPGQAASEAFLPLLPVLAAVGIEHDLILVDQRGTGGSAPLDCPIAKSLRERFADGALARAAARCRPELAADLSAYTTAASAADLEAVRAALGYRQLNLLGISYGTRLAMAYAAAYPQRVRSMVLDGVVPPAETLPLGFARTGQRALDQVIGRCAADRDCARAFPDLARDLGSLLDGLLTTPANVTVRHPRSGQRESLTLSRGAVAQALRDLLYAPELVALLPLTIERAASGDFSSLVSQDTTLGEQADEGLSLGLTLTVLCREDVAHIDASAVTAATAGTFIGPSIVNAFREACARWPIAAPAPAPIDRPATAPPLDAPIDAPALLLSGALDPVTPPSAAERTLRYLTRGRSVVFAGMGHGVTMRGCAPRLIAELLDAPTELMHIDAKCALRDLAPAFFIDGAGPLP